MATVPIGGAGRRDPADLRPRDVIPIRRALVSVSDKSGLVDLARLLAGNGVEISAVSDMGGVKYAHFGDPDGNRRAFYTDRRHAPVPIHERVGNADVQQIHQNHGVHRRAGVAGAL